PLTISPQANALRRQMRLPSPLPSLLPSLLPSRLASRLASRVAGICGAAGRSRASARVRTVSSSEPSWEATSLRRRGGPSRWLCRSVRQFDPAGTGDRSTLAALSSYLCTEREPIRLVPARSFDVPARAHYCSGL